jgi:tetratricopeptide (TPR) repeat protein
MANAMDGLGDLTGALQMQQQSLAAFNQIGDRRGAAATLNNLGNLFVEMGNLTEARASFEQALAITQEISYRGGEPYAIAGLGNVLLASGDLAGATKQYEQAIAISKENKDDQYVAEIENSVALIALVEGRFSDGEALARQNVPIFEKANSGSDNSWAHALLARSLLSEGKVTEAQEAASQAMTISRQVSGESSSYEAVLADSRVKARSGKRAEARKELETMLASARKHGYRLYEFNARLALAEIEIEAHSPWAPSRLAALENDARTNGAVLVANQAHVLWPAK